MIAAALRALSQIFSPAFRGVLLRSIGLTLLLLAAVWAGLFWMLDWLVDPANPWIETALQVLTGIGLLVGLGFLVAPVTALFAGLFLDDIAAEVERTDYPLDPPGRPVPLGEGIASALRFTLVVIGVNLVVLVLLLLPGINVAAFLIANAYLLGREYFEAVAMRFHSREAAVALRSEHSTRIFLAGLAIAFVLAIPIVNLMTPLFATAFMVHIYKGLPRAGQDLPVEATPDRGTMP